MGIRRRSKRNLHPKGQELKVLEILNENIKNDKLFVIFHDKTTQVMARLDALQEANKQKKDLFVISYNNDKMPVCLIGDFRKYKYQKIKQHKLKFKKIAAQNIVKRITMRANIDNNDLLIKAKKINQFLANNQRVRISLRLFGRQIANKEIFLKSFYNLIGLLENCDNKGKAMNNIEQKKNLFEVIALPSKKNI